MKRDMPRFTLIELLVACEPKLPGRGRRPIRARFTLIELLVVIAVISVLAALLLPALKRAKEVAKSTCCKSNLKQIYVPLHMYMDDNNGWIPSIWSWSSTGPNYGTANGIVVYLNDKKDIFYECPDSPYYRTTTLNYGLNDRIGGVYQWPKVLPKKRLMQIRHPSGTIGFIDGRGPNDPWYARPRIWYYSSSYHSCKFGWQRHGERPNFVCMDGHVDGKLYAELDVYSNKVPNWWYP